VSGFDDAVFGVVSDLLTFAGESVTYLRGNQSATLTMRRSTQSPQYIDNGNGSIQEVRPVDFIGLASDLPYAVPEAGDRIHTAGRRFEVCPTTGEKVFRQITATMIRVHTKEV